MMSLEAIKYQNGNLEILDQLLLPGTSKYIIINNVNDGWNAIKTMQVRGAPAIAIVGCLSLCVELKRRSFQDKTEFHNNVVEKLRYLETSRPTAVNMKQAAVNLINLSGTLLEDDSLNVKDMQAKFIEATEEMLQNDISDNKAIGHYGATEILKQFSEGCKVRLLTHCNTGSLATAGYGTALGVIRSVHAANRLETVYFTETRPYNQGARLTAYELIHDKIPHTLIADSMVAALMKLKDISGVVVGADRVALNGDTANKIGTYQIAVVAKQHNVPFYIAAPFTSIDKNIPNGDHIIIEERPAKEMTHIGSLQFAASGVNCWNPAFDVTPASLIAGIITEKGVFKPEDLRNAF